MRDGGSGEHVTLLPRSIFLAYWNGAQNVFLGSRACWELTGIEASIWIQAKDGITQPQSAPAFSFRHTMCNLHTTACTRSVRRITERVAA
eukprot:321218-Rhodomonas_salina.1